MKTLQNISFAIALISLVACGGNTTNKDNAENDNNTNNNKTEEVAPVETATTPDTVELHLSAKGEDMSQISFDPQTLDVPAGSHVKLVFHNESSAAGMLHNFVLIPSGIGQEIAIEGIKAGLDNDYVPADDRVIAHTKVTQLGEKITFEFDAPAKGTYEYICTYPGHYPGMKGTFTVN